VILCSVNPWLAKVKGLEKTGGSVPGKYGISGEMVWLKSIAFIPVRKVLFMANPGSFRDIS
jgi:hypothetical protein